MNLAWAIVLGCSLGLGLWLVVTCIPALGAPRLTARLAPYIMDVSAEARLFVRARDGSASGEGLWLAGWQRLRRRFLALLGSADVTEVRLRRAGSALDLDGYRSQQLTAMVFGALAGAAAGAVAWSHQTAPLVFALAAVVVGGLLGVVLRDRWLQRQAARRTARLIAELPMVLEFLTLSLSAGEGIVDALRRVGRVMHGELAGELSHALNEVSTGIPLADALRRVATDLDLVPVSRFVDQLTVALERGSPLAEVLRAQAQDARDDGRRALLELAGRKEVAMLIPLVFLILPVTILFAVFPGIVLFEGGL